MSLLSLLLVSPQASPQLPVLWLHPDGGAYVAGKPVQPRITPGARRVPTREGAAYWFEGTRGGVLLPDLANFRLTHSLSVSTWMRPTRYWSDGPGAQVLFRGDDRSGLDPYTLVVHGNGTVNFSVGDEKYAGMAVSGELALNRWTHVLGTFDGDTGALALYLDGALAATARTSKRPFALLREDQAPGLGVGNVQNDRGPHNQPYNGWLYDVRLYDRVVGPAEAGLNERVPRVDPR